MGRRRNQMELVQHLVIAGVPGETAAIVGAACFDQKHLSPRFFGRPKVSQDEAQQSVEGWLAQHTGVSIASGRPGVSAVDVQALIGLIF